MLNNNVFETKTELETALAKAIIEQLAEAVDRKGHACILFSGGSTPKGLMQRLAKTDYDWSKVKIALVDDRVVPQKHEKSNIRFIQENFLNLLNGSFSFYPWVIRATDLDRNLQIAQVSLRAFGHADIAILGMGTDGHFASLFPEDSASEIGLALDNDMNLLYTRAPAAPKQRITLSWGYLRKVPKLYLHITGGEKRALLEDPKARLELPINTLISDKQTTVELFWAP